jgi:D-alanyl-D-alanine carboxypeptidase (penicillin-binding protein 5/6)
MFSSRAFGVLALASVIALAAPADAQRRRAAPPQASAAQPVTIKDGASGANLACEVCNTPIPPASMSKLMTVLIVLEQLEAGDITLDTEYPVSEYAWREHGAPSGGSHMFLPVHSQVSVRELLRGAIIVSANDACVVLAEGIAGSEAAFAELMNHRARELGLTTASFSNATGVDAPNHHISSADLARLARHVMTTYPQYYRIYSELEFTFNNRTQQNRNPLLGAFEGADGVKTGHTDDSGYGLIGSAIVNGERRIIVFNGTRSMADRRSEAVRLMRSAFADYAVRTLASAGDQVGEAEVRLGGRRTVPLIASTDIMIGGRRGVQSTLTAHIVYQGPIQPPTREGDVVAQLVVEGPGYATQSFPLTAGRRVGKANWFSRAWEGLRLTLFGP